MLKDSIHICHSPRDAHWLTPDPAWSRYSFGLDVCIREGEIGERRDNPLLDAVAGAAARLVRRARGDRLAA